MQWLISSVHYLSAVMENLVYFASLILNANFYLMSTTVGVLTSAFEIVSSLLWNAFQLVHVTTTDFFSFLGDIAVAVATLHSNVCDCVTVALQYSVDCVLNVLKYYHCLLNTFHTETKYAVFSFKQFISFLISCLTYCGQIVYSSVLFMLIDVPISLCNIPIDLLFKTVSSTMLICENVWVGATCVCYTTLETLKNIPFEAYMGLIMASFIIIMMKRLRLHVYNIHSIILADVPSFIHVLTSLMCTFITKLFHTVGNFLCPGENAYVVVNPEEVLGDHEQANTGHVEREENHEMSFVSSESTRIGPSDSESSESYKLSVIKSIRNLKIKLNEERDRLLCVICQDEPKSMMLLPCKHLCLCVSCTSTLRRDDNFCPVCRHIILDCWQVFI